MVSFGGPAVGVLPGGGAGIFNMNYLFTKPGGTCLRCHPKRSDVLAGSDS